MATTRRHCRRESPFRASTFPDPQAEGPGGAWRGRAVHQPLQSPMRAAGEASLYVSTGNNPCSGEADDGPVSWEARRRGF